MLAGKVREEVAYLGMTTDIKPAPEDLQATINAAVARAAAWQQEQQRRQDERRICKYESWRPRYWARSFYFMFLQSGRKI